LAIRPTADYLRESVFNILAGTLEDSNVLDLFAGTGSLGIEALSRGAASAFFIDKNPLAIRALVRNISACALQARCTIVRKDILKGLRFLKPMEQRFDLVFMDPPYNQGFVGRTLNLLGSAECMADEASVVIEHSLHESLPEKVAHFRQIEQRHYRKTLVSFYKSVL